LFFLFYCLLFYILCMNSERAIIVSYRIVHVYCQEWKDHRLAWNENEFAKITQIVVKIEDMWVPDVTLMNT